MTTNRRITPQIKGLEYRVVLSGLDGLSVPLAQDIIGTVATEVASQSIDEHSRQKTIPPVPATSKSSEVMAEEKGMTMMPMWGMPPMDEGIMSLETTLDYPPLFPNLARLSMKRSSFARMTMRRSSLETTMKSDMSIRISGMQQGMVSSPHSEIRIRSRRRNDIDTAIMEMYGEQGQTDQGAAPKERSDQDNTDQEQGMQDPFTDPETPTLEVPLRPDLTVPLNPTTPEGMQRSSALQEVLKPSPLKSTNDQEHPGKNESLASMIVRRRPSIIRTISDLMSGLWRTARFFVTIHPQGE